MTSAQEGAYIRLLTEQWQSHDCTVPSDPEKVLFLLKRDITVKDVKVILKCFEPLPDEPEKMRNPKLYDGWLKSKRRHEQATNAARARHASAQAKEPALAKKKKAPKVLIDYEMFRKAWNAQASPKGWKVAASMSDKRKDIIRDWIKEKPTFLDDYCEAIEWQNSPNWRGESDSGWRADFDFSLRRPSRKYPVGVVYAILEDKASGRAKPNIKM